MANSQRQIRQQTTLGDAAVDGLLAGGMAGGLMAAYLVVAGVMQGEAIGTMLARFDPRADVSPVVGLFTHLAVACVYGALFGLGWRVVARVWPLSLAWLAGLTYGLVLLGLAQALLLPSAASALRVISTVHFAIAHAVYGLAVGFGVAQRRRRAE